MVRALRTLLLCFLLACVASAFQVTGRLLGKLEDAAGRPVAGARVILTLAESAAVYAETLTSPNGTFLFANLKPVVYGLTVGELTLRNVRVDPAADTSLPPIRLGASQSQSQQQSLQTAAVDVASTADEQQVSQLP